MQYGEIKIFAANANPQLARAVVGHLGVELGKSETGRFNDGEVSVRINETVRGADVFIIQSTGAPAEHLMELLIMIDAMRRSSAGRITAVVPYFGYARQDRRARSHDPISARLVADMITTAGADRIVSMDLHCPQIQGFFKIPMDHLRGLYNFAKYLTRNKQNLSNVVIVAPDLGSVSRCNAFASMLDLPMAIIDKRRNNDTNTEVVNFIGDVKGKVAVLLDDVIATGTSLCNAAEAVKAHGAAEIFACVTHPVLSGNAIENITKSPIQQLVVINTLEIPPEKLHPKVHVLSMAKFLSEAIQCIHENRSIGRMFKDFSGINKDV